MLLVLLSGLVKIYFYFTEKDKVLVYCDFEKYKNDGESIIYSTNNLFHKVKVVAKNSSKFAYSGENCLQLNNEEFVNLVELKNINPDEVYKATIFRKTGTAGIVLQEITAEPSKVYKFQKFASETTSDGWEKLEVQLRTPPNYTGNNLKIYLWNPTKELCYFDDLRIEQIEYMEYPDYDSINSINIFVENAEFKKLKRIKEDAFERGILITEDDSYVNTIMAYDGTFFEGAVRFKGDWLDHLEGDKWSFRVKVSDGAWKNLCVFSLHTPFSRSFINEWLIHKVFQDNDILATRYDFVPVKINQRPLGIYAYEEHFVKQVLEGQLRREGPIIALSEDDLWNRRSVDLKSRESFIFSSSVIEPFQQNKVMKDSAMYNKFIIAQNLLGSYKSGKLSASDVFDIKKIAKFFAIETAFGAYHGAVWHNMRFYLNPVTCRLEPIAFDCYANYGIYTWGFTNIIGNFNISRNKYLSVHSAFYMSFITDTAFANEYVRLLRKYTNSSVSDEYICKYRSEIKERESLIQKEFLNYYFDENAFKEHSKLIKHELDAFENNLSRPTYLDSLKVRTNNVREQANKDDNYAYFSDYVKFYINSSSKILTTVSHKNEIEIVGFGNEKDIKKQFVQKVNNTNKANTYKQEFSVSADLLKEKYIYFKTSGYDTVYKSKIVQWPAPTTYNPRTDIATTSTDLSEYIDHENKEVHFSGSLRFDKHVYTPYDYTVIIDPGTTIDITNQSAFIVNANVIINGTLENPVMIHSSDKTANGFTILQSDKQSVVNYAHFDNLTTLNYNGWTLTGAVTFYEADVEFNNCQFTNNHCEDMLNTVRCHFSLKNCTIENTFGDSHDSDFCTGTLDNCTFNNNGNDAIDFSTSESTITNCIINGAGDKGISVGENTQATIIDVTISDVNIGIASKDLSHAEVNGCVINRATYGFLILQKKPEFGSASITAYNCELNDVWTKSLIERNSTLVLNGKKIEGKKAKLKSLFYE